MTYFAQYQPNLTRGFWRTLAWELHFRPGDWFLIDIDEKWATVSLSPIILSVNTTRIITREKGILRIKVKVDYIYADVIYTNIEVKIIE